MSRYKKYRLEFPNGKHKVIEYRIKNKKKSLLMRIAGRVINRKGRISYNDFMNKYSTTIRRTIYAPDGKISKKTLNHECVHIWQWKHYNGFAIKYARNTYYRAFYEVEAYMLTDPDISLARLKLKLKKYGCSIDDVDRAYHVVCRKYEFVEFW